MLFSHLFNRVWFLDVDWNLNDFFDFIWDLLCIEWIALMFFSQAHYISHSDSMTHMFDNWIRFRYFNVNWDMHFFDVWHMNLFFTIKI